MVRSLRCTYCCCRFLQPSSFVPRNIRVYSSADYEKPDVRKLAKMAQLHVTDEEVAAWTPQLDKVTEFFAQLQAIDLTDVPPMLRVQTEGKSDLRKDEVVEHPAAQSLLNNVPDTDGEYLKVPKIQ